MITKRTTIHCFVGLSLFLGCQQQPTNAPLPTPTAAVPDAADAATNVFETLTSNEWAKSHASFGHSHSEKIVFRRDGTYHWRAESDYVERDENAKYTLKPTGKNTGVVYLEGRSDITFSVSGNELKLAGRTFQAGEEIDDDSVAPIPASVPPSATWKRLVETTWVHANDFDEYRKPRRVDFEDDGTFSASYRDDECRHGGSWSLVFERPRTMLEMISEANKCDTRGPGTAGALAGAAPFWVDQLLVCQGTYRPESAATERRVCIFDRYTNDVQTRLEYGGALRQGVATKIHFEHKNVTDRADSRVLLRLVILLQQAVPGETSFQLEGEAVELGRTDFARISLAHGETKAHEITITPHISGFAYLQLVFDYTSTSQPYRGGGDFFLDVLPSE